MEVEWSGQWYKAKSIAADGERRKVHYTNYSDSWDEWVGPDRMRPYRPTHFDEGTKVQVQWETDRKWYPATVLKAWYGMGWAEGSTSDPLSAGAAWQDISMPKSMPSQNRKSPGLVRSIHPEMCRRMPKSSPRSGTRIGAIICCLVSSGQS